MNVVGLITEYNPFHNGHKYHLEKSKELSGASHSVAVMSGNFLQRGEPALLDKWVRAEIAVREGVDLVIELPTIFSCNSAEFFAFGGISLLESLKIVDSFCFGSELGSLDDLHLVSDLLINEPLDFKDLLKKHLDNGLTFPLARQKAMGEYLGNKLENISTLSSPNNILGIEYLKALKVLKSNIIPLTIKRIAAEYNSTEINGKICSATAIRKLLKESHTFLEDLENVVPPNSYEVIKKAITEGKGPIFSSDLEQIIFYRLRTISIDDLKHIHDINEGLENRLKSGASLSATYSSLIQFLKTKRYTQTRLQRALIKTVLGITSNDIVSFSEKNLPHYIRVLGFNDKGAALLKRIKKESDLPIITNLKRYDPQNDIASRMIEIDKMATDVYTLLYKNLDLTKGGQDYTKKPYINPNYSRKV
ncbi:nucleotidyltransferase [Wukongibacter baidiensis]|uniref:nucleotidyltransferase n=1 Tax=Wukongibacter baidiensis TaxID=1723361 RepID=UPI003D7F9B62